MFTNNGIIVANSASTSLSSLLGVLKDFSGSDVTGSSLINSNLLRQLFLVGSDFNSNSLKYAANADALSGSYVFVSAGKRTEDADKDTYQPVFSNVSCTVGYTAGYGSLTFVNSTDSDIEINEIDLSFLVGTFKVLFELFQFPTVTLAPQESFYIRIMHK